MARASMTQHTRVRIAACISALARVYLLFSESVEKALTVGAVSK
jgi:hypothetical protein